MCFFSPKIMIPRSHAAAYDFQSTGEVPHSVRPANGGGGSIEIAIRVFSENGGIPKMDGL